MKFSQVGLVEEILAERPGVQELRVGCDPGSRTAIALTQLTGPVAVGERVLLNTVAVELGLGTGGYDFVTARLDSLERNGDAPGHILKLRYTPLQMPVLSVEAPESPHHMALKGFSGLRDTPVVCAELHSQLPAICSAAHWSMKRPPRIAYIMTDSAALPVALSRIVPELKARGWITASVSAGQAFGGDYEAVTLYSALAAARCVVRADIIVVAPGPGTVGTGTSLGFSGVDQGLAINAAASLGGTVVAAARISFADPRERHAGLSHHTVNALCTVARASALLPLPRLPAYQRDMLQASLEESGIAEHHEPVTIDADKGLAAFEESGFHVTTMGRPVSQERPFFLAAAAAGLLAAQIAEALLDWTRLQDG